MRSFFVISKQIKAHSKVKVCHICLEGFKIKDRKVRDHCYYTGKYRGAAHSNCNLQYKILSHIPVIFHNLSGYDAHLFIRELSKHTSSMALIAKNKEDYILAVTVHFIYSHFDFFFKLVAFCTEFNLFTPFVLFPFMIMDLPYICDDQVGYSAGGYLLSPRWFLTWCVYPFFQD